MLIPLISNCRQMSNPPHTLTLSLPFLPFDADVDNAADGDNAVQEDENDEPENLNTTTPEPVCMSK